MLPQPVQPNPNAAKIEALNQQQNKLREHLRQSELNLKMQRDVRQIFYEITNKYFEKKISGSLSTTT